MDAVGNIQLWTEEEFRSAFGASPDDAFIAASNRNSGGSGIWLSTPRFNGSDVFCTALKYGDDDRIVKVPPGGVAYDVPVAYLVVVY